MTPWIRNIPETWANNKGWRTDIPLSTLSGASYDPAEFHLEDGTWVRIPMEEMRRALRTANVRANRMVGPFNVNPHDGTVNGQVVEMEVRDADGTVRSVTPKIIMATSSVVDIAPEPTDTTDDSKADARARIAIFRREFFKAGGAAVVGGAAALAGTGVTGGMGLSIAGTAVAIGAAPVAIAGAVVGLAGYGIYRAIKG